MRTLRGSLTRVAAVLLTVQVAGAALSLAAGFLECGTNRAACCCCQRESGGLCPLAGRATRMTARCGCGCQDRDALPAPGPDPLAILSDACVAAADLCAWGAPAVAMSPVSDLTPTPPSPPPWRTSSHTILSVC